MLARDERTELLANCWTLGCKLRKPAQYQWELKSTKYVESRENEQGAYENEILRKLGEMEEPRQRGQTVPSVNNANTAKPIKQRGQEAKPQALYRMSGVDITQIDAIGVETVEVVLSEYGPDLSRFPTEKEFVAHVTLAPRVPSRRGSPHEPSIEPLNQRIKHPLLQSDRVQKSIDRGEGLFLGDGFSLSTRVIISALLRPTY